MNKLKDMLETVRGYLSEEEALTLYMYAKETTGCIVEIGSYRGRSTCMLAQGSKDGHKVRVYAIDPHTSYIDGTAKFGFGDNLVYMHNLVKFDFPEVNTINLPSVQVAKCWSDPVGLLFIDGRHEYEYVKADFDAWVPFVKPDGYILMHDVTLEGPARLIKELKNCKLIQRNDFLGVLKWEK